MLEKLVFVEVLRQSSGWHVVAGGPPRGNVPWVNLWLSVHKAIIEGRDPKRVFWTQLDNLVVAKNRTAMAANREIAEEEARGSNVKDTFSTNRQFSTTWSTPSPGKCPMSDLVQLETRLTFREAADRACELALQFKHQTGVHRSDSGWVVLVPSRFARPRHEIDEEHLFSEEIEALEEVEAERRELAEELKDDQEDWARSDQEGWYYNDEDNYQEGSHDSQYGRFQAPRDSFGNTLPKGSGC